MLTASKIAAHTQGDNHIVIEDCDATIDYTIADGTATLDASQLADFFDRDDVSFSLSERAEVQSYLESVAEGND